MAKRTRKSQESPRRGKKLSVKKQPLKDMDPKGDDVKGGGPVRIPPMSVVSRAGRATTSLQ
jgi:hypothetical protein